MTNLKMDTIKNIKKTITSQKVTFKDSRGRDIVAYVDFKEMITKENPFIVIVPGYAETKRDYISTSYYLVSNGFRVMRFDSPNHIGESQGEIADFLLSDIENGIKASMDYIRDNYGIKSIGLLASSLSGRVAFKSAHNDKRIAFLILLTGIVDIKKTLITLYKEDLITEYSEGKRWGCLDILGFEVNDRFLGECIENHYTDLKTTIEDVKKIQIPVCYICAEKDAWVENGDVKKVFKEIENKKSQLITISSALHQIQENPKLAKKAIMEITKTCSYYSGKGKLSDDQCNIPDIHDIVVQNKTEASNLKNCFGTEKNDEKVFWADYLSKFFVIMRSKDYQDLLSLVIQLLNGISSSDHILDAGCGNGHLGAWILSAMKKTQKFSLDYTGLDLVDKAIDDARELHKNIIDQKSLNSKVKMHYVISDLELKLPFEDQEFTKICCNLVVSYLNRYDYTMKELFRVLKPGGRIVVSSLKPYADLSMIYKDYMDQEITLDDILEGRKLLSSAGKIRHKEKQGIYQFFSEGELEKLMLGAGFTSIKFFRSFGNQANVVVGIKN